VGAKLSLKSVAGLAGVSIPYLSQVERGLRRPSADILQAIAKGLRISAETLYVQAGILDERPAPDVAAAIMGDPTITERQKQALVQIYHAFREEAGRTPSPGNEGETKPPHEAEATQVSPASGSARRPARSSSSAKPERRRKEV
jgi:transcriptional regulator with XRE-family HTH domain